MKPHWKRRYAIVALAVAVMAGTAGYLLGERFHGTSAGNQPAEESVVGAARPDYRHADSEGQFVDASDFDGRVVLVNFWATWCQPCREEMPMLAQLQRDLRPEGVQIVGIALDEVASAREFAAELGITYPILVGTTDVMVTVQKYGNRSGALPYSVLIDREGVIAWTWLGPLERHDLEPRIRELL